MSDIEKVDLNKPESENADTATVEHSEGSVILWCNLRLHPFS